MAQSPSRRQPIDRGWSWMVCLSGSVIRFLLNGFWTSIGLFFIHWERDFDTSASSVAIIGSIIMCQWFMGECNCDNQILFPHISDVMTKKKTRFQMKGKNVASLL